MLEVDGREDVLIQELGVSGLRHQFGVIDEEWLHRLRGEPGLQQYREMRDNDALVGISLFLWELLALRVPWVLKPSREGNRESEEWATKVRCILFERLARPWGDIISEAMSMLVFGWAAFEILWERRDDGLEVSDLAFRSQDTLSRWEIDERGVVLGLVQRHPQSMQEIPMIPIHKLLLFIRKSHKGNPEGQSFLRHIYRSWYIKKHLEDIEAIGEERNLSGLPIAWVPSRILRSDAPAEDVATREWFKKLVTRVRRDEQMGVLLPLAYSETGQKLYDFELLTTKRDSGIHDVIARYDQMILMGLLTDVLLLGGRGGGSFSLGEAKIRLLLMVVRELVKRMAETVERSIIQRMWKLNNWPLEHMPRIIIGRADELDLGQLALFLRAMASVGLPIDDLADEIRMRAGFDRQSGKD